MPLSLETAPGLKMFIPKLHNLQVLRAAAASLVVADHAIELLVRREAIAREWTRIAWFVGWLGVATFFVISGFIMITSSAHRFGTRHEAFNFILRRLIRVVPMYWIATAIFALILLSRTGALSVPDFFRSLFFIPYWSYAEQAMHPITAQGWTLNLEMLFYLVFGLCLVFPRPAGLSTVIFSFPVIVVCGLLWRPLFPYTDPQSALAFFIQPITLLFTFGMLIGITNRSLFLSGWSYLASGLSVPIYATLILLFLMRNVGFPLQFFDQILFGFGCVLIVGLCSSRGRSPKSRAGMLLEMAGDASYSTYLFHPLVISLLAAIWDRAPDAFRYPLIFVSTVLVASNLAGLLIFKYLERPITLLLTSLRSKIARADGVPQ